MTRTAREVVELYNLVVWNERDFALAEELMGDTVIRHDVGEATTLTHEQAVARIVDHWEMFETIRFDLNLVVAGDDGEHVAIVYQSPMKLKDGTETDRRQHGDLPRRRRQDHRSLELRLQTRSVGSDRTACSTNWATTCWPAPAVRARPTLMDEARRGEELGFGTGFISERWNVKEASSLIGAALRGHQPDADRHGRNQSQHPPPADHRLVGHHDAPAVRRAASPWASAAASRRCTTRSACRR